MKETPIIYSPAMIKAKLEGRKSQTRRIIKLQPKDVGAARIGGPYSWMYIKNTFAFESNSGKVGIFNPPYLKCPYGGQGDLLWTKETYGISWQHGALIDPCITYRADGKQVPIIRGTEIFDRWEEVYRKPRKRPWNPDAWQPSIFMYRFLSRFSDEITETRAEIVQDISIEDITAEGIPKSICMYYDDHGGKYFDEDEYRSLFQELWDSINGSKYPWSSYPWWVWVIGFKPFKKS